MQKLPLYILFILAAIFACKKISHEEIEAKPLAATNTSVPVRVEAIGVAASNESIEALCYVSSESEAKPAFKTGGVINRTYFKEGDKVRKGQLLASLIMTEINAQVSQAEEGLSKAVRDKERVQNLHLDNVATDEQLQNATTALEVARKSVEIAKFNKSYSQVYAPISGIIVKQIMHDGEIVGPGMPIYAIMGIDNKDWKITASLTDRDWAGIKVGNKCTVSLDAFPDKKFSAKVVDKSLVGGNASGTLDIKLKFIDQPKNLAAGLVGKVFIKSDFSQNSIVIPLSAITKIKGNTATVFTEENGKSRKLVIQVGKIIGKSIEVLSGLDGVKTIVTTGAMYLEDGDNIVLQ